MIGVVGACLEATLARIACKQAPAIKPLQLGVA